jgi:hypothetical protein
MARNLLISYNFERETQHGVDIEINNATDVEAVERIVNNLITKKRGEKDKENNNVRNNAIKKTMRVFNDILNVSCFSFFNLKKDLKLLSNYFDKFERTLQLNEKMFIKKQFDD